MEYLGAKQNFRASFGLITEADWWELALRILLPPNPVSFNMC